MRPRPGRAAREGRDFFPLGSAIRTIFRRMRASSVFASIILPAAFLSWPEARAQAGGEFHEFTDKRGQKVTAKLLGISEDRRVMNIVREDGKAFETVVNQLSLDDQQFVKDWLKSRPASGAPPAPGRFRLEVAATRSVGETRKHRDENYTMEEKDHLFRIAVKNLSREAVPSARVEYAVVWSNAVTIVEDKDEGEWHFRSHSDDQGVSPRVKVLGEAAIENLRFNAEFAVETVPVGIDRVFYDGNELYREDQLLGVRIRVVAADGALLLDTHSGGAEVGSMKWEEIEALEGPPSVP